MTEQEKRFMHLLVTNTPRSVWRFGPFWIPALLTLAGLALTIYLRIRVSDLEIVLRHEYRIVRVWNSEQVAKMLPSLSMLLTLSFVWNACIGWFLYQQVRLLKAMTKEAGIEGEGAGGFWTRRAEIGRDLRKHEFDFLLPFFAGICVLGLLGTSLEAIAGRENEGFIWGGFVIGFFGLIALLCVKSRTRTKVAMRDHGLECDGCGYFPIGQTAIDRALEDGVCPKCGGRLGVMRRPAAER